MRVLSLRIPLGGSLLALLCSSALVGQTPADTAATVGAAEQAAQAWLAIVDKGDIAKSWDEAAVAFQLAVTQEKWEQLVVQLREVFDARGTTRSDGSFRQWTNGNLQVLLEPTETGHRLRFRTVHGAARASIGAGLAALGVTATVAIATAVNGHVGDAMSGIVFLLAAGVGMILNGAIRLPGWARLRGRQMDALAAQMASRPKAPAGGESS